MESLAAFPNGEWDSFNGLFSIEELEFTQQLHLFSFPLEHGEGLSIINPSTFSSKPGANMSSAGINESLSYSNHEAYYLSGPNHIAATNETTMSLNISMDNNGGISDKITESFPPAFPNITMEDGTVNVIEDLSTGHCLGKLEYASHPAANVVVGNELLLNRKFNVLELHAEGDQFDCNISSENTKKRPRVSKDGSKVCKNVRYSKKNSKINLNGNEGDSKIDSDGQSCITTCSSEDDNVSQDTNNGVATSDSKGCQALNLNGKKRASRGTATDPQSLYSRKRRERINERLRILQNLVPNGTKVDISTMLEEAVHYVKFLQLQIKLLSSDDLWMYAPIAYNGIDIGLNKKISKLLYMNPGKEATLHRS